MAGATEWKVPRLAFQSVPQLPANAWIRSEEVSSTGQIWFKGFTYIEAIGALVAGLV